MDDPILKLMKAIRETHGMSQLQVAAAMGVAEDTYRHIEKGRRPLPDIRQGEFTRWMRLFLDAVGASDEERTHLTELAARVVLEEVSHILDKRRSSP